METSFVFAQYSTNINNVIKQTFVTTQRIKICEHFNFKKIYSICDNFIVTYDTNKLYIFEPTSNELLFHMEFSNTIQDIAFVKNNIYVWKNDLEIVHIAVVELESLILATLYNKQYHLCMDICLEFISKVLQLLETSKQLHLISVLNNKLSNQKAATKMQPIFDKIKEMNQKESTHTLLKRNIVLVENLHMNKEIEIPSIKFEQEDPEKDLQIILKQYKLNKTHRTIDIPEVQHLLDTFTGDEMFLKFKAFQEYVTTNLNEDATEWCRLQYLKNISIRDISATTLSSEAKDYLTEAVIKENEPYRFSCECGYPTPKCYKYPPTYFNTALDVLHIAKDELKILRAVPYLWQYALKFNVQGPRLAVLIQYGELEFFKDYTLLLPYDQWHDIVGYYIKIRNKGVCVNCDNKIDLEDLISWTDLAKIIVESIGARNTIRLLKNYSLFIPKGSLDPNFYQTCIFANSVVNEYRPCREKSGLIFQFLNNLDSSNQDKLQDKIAKYFTHKHVASKKGYYMKSSRESGECGMCKLPLDNDILLDCLPSTNCKHKFHKFCLEQSDNTSRNCNLC
ncbi:hypothetical protein ABEB36_005114 [Hypothenemus hampei]|uniref:RING-type domain-containing protein n=1 Tax=Hypothenemus hampei TaxID=57062 RepID=A0ABD1EX10_HYPHA